MFVSNVCSRINFLAGKVHLYSDFDGTYCPVSHSALQNNDKNINCMHNYCKKMQNLFQSTGKNLHFHITTGRTFGEYKAVSQLIKERGFALPLPETFIAKNGSDEYTKIGSDKDFYIKNEFPFDYNKTNRSRRSSCSFRRKIRKKR